MISLESPCILNIHTKYYYKQADANMSSAPEPGISHVIEERAYPKMWPADMCFKGPSPFFFPNRSSEVTSL
jgi:hypothetical protein